MGQVETSSTPIQSLVQMVSSGAIELPEIQRGYVWTRPQVRDLLDSLYRRYPVGALLVWNTERVAHARALEGTAGQPGPMESVRFLLDGQQRLTSLARVFAGTESAPDIRFNLETEKFEVANAVIRRDPTWVPVTDVFRRGPVVVATERDLLHRPDASELLQRLNDLSQIGNIMLPVHVLRDFSYEEVTEIFVRVNSKGTRLREAELAIARLAFRLPGMVTEEMKSFEESLDEAGWDIDLRYLVRFLTAVATGTSRFPSLQAADEKTLTEAWRRTKTATEYSLNLLKQNLGIESAEWLPSRLALLIPVAYLARTPAPRVDTRRLLRWFLLASTWQRYSGSSETILDRDLRVLHESPDPLTDLVKEIAESTPRIHVTAEDLDDANVGSPFFLLSYLACRANGASDWWHDVKLSSTNLGTDHALHLHHIFPKALVSGRYPRRDVNEMANIAFLSQKANLAISKSEPAEYLPGVIRDRLDAQYIPSDPDLYRLDRFQDFLAARRALLASAMNDLIDSLA